MLETVFYVAENMIVMKVFYIVNNSFFKNIYSYFNFITFVN